MERNYIHIVAMRVWFLRQMVNLCLNNDSRPVVYLDETWVNQNHMRNYISQNLEDSEGLKVLTGRGGSTNYLSCWF